MTRDTDLLLVEHRGDICWVTINRPADRNSINTALMEKLEHLLAETEKTSARAMVFSGAGGQYFIGGADGIEMMQLDQEGGLQVFSTNSIIVQPNGGKPSYPGSGYKWPLFWWGF